MANWSGSVRLDEYVTIKALRRQIAFADRDGELFKKPQHKLNEELATSLCKEVEGLCATLRVFGLFADSCTDLKQRAEVMKRIREELGDVFLCSVRVANALDVDIARSVHEKIYPVLKNSDKPSWR